MRKKSINFYLFAAMFVLFTVNNSYSQVTSSINRVGTTAAQFLKIGVGARPIGMGGAYTAVGKDILAVYWNPAGLSRIVGNGEATFNHAQWLAETDFDFAAFSLSVPDLGSFGFHVVSLRIPEEPVRTVESPDGTGQTWDASSISLGISYARDLTDRFSIGITAKFIQESIFNETARGAALDLGVLYDTPIRNLTLGASIANFGTKMRLDGRDLYHNDAPLSEQGSVDAVPAKYRTESYDIPLNLKFGLAWRAIKNDNVEVVAAVDGNQPNDNSEYVNSGLEMGFQNVIFLRGGYKALFLDNSEQGLTFGAGLKYDVVGANLKFDFGWADYGRLKDVKFVSLAIKY
jgi:hypothetical protein